MSILKLPEVEALQVDSIDLISWRQSERNVINFLNVTSNVSFVLIRRNHW